MNYKEKAKQQIDEMAAQIEKLEAKKDMAQADVKMKYEQQLGHLKNKKAQAQAKFEELKDASNERWEEARDVFASATESFKQGFSELTKLVS